MEMWYLYGNEFSASVQALSGKVQHAISDSLKVGRQATGCSGYTAGSEASQELGASVK